MGVPGTINPKTGNVYGGAPRESSPNVEPSGRVTPEGKPIYQAKKTETDVQREVSEQRVQTFTSGGQKISDTGRVEVVVGGEKKWVQPEKAMATSPKGTIKYREAEKKIQEREKLADTLRGRTEQPKEESESMKRLDAIREGYSEKKEPAKRYFISMTQDPYQQGTGVSKKTEPSKFVSIATDPYGQGSDISSKITQPKPKTSFLQPTRDLFGSLAGTGKKIGGSLATPIKQTKDLPVGLKLIDRELVAVTGTKEVKAPEGLRTVPKGTSLIDFNLLPEAALGTFAANPQLAVTTAKTAYSGVKAGLQTVDYIGNIVRGWGPIKAVSDTGFVGRLAVKGVTYGAETYATVKGLDYIGESIAPKVPGVSKGELKDIYATGSRAEFATGFKPKESSSLYGWVGRGAEAFITGGIGFYAEPLATTKAKESYAATVISGAKEKGFTSEQIRLTEERGEFLRKWKGTTRWLGFTQAEAFANIVGGEEIALAKAAGKMKYLRTTKAGAEIFKFKKWTGAFGAKAIPGWVEGSIATGVTVGTIYPNAPYLPGIKTTELDKGYDSLTDSTFKTKRIDITEEQFAELEGKASPLGPLPSKTNIVYNIIGKPTSTEVNVLTDEGIETTTTTTIPRREVILSQSKEAEKAETDVLQGKWISKTGEQKQFIPGKVLAVVGGGLFGIFSAGTFGVIENSKLFTGKIGSKVIAGVGYVSDVPELPGDILTSTVTSPLGRTIPITTYSPIISTTPTMASFTTAIEKEERKQDLYSQFTSYDVAGIETKQITFTPSPISTPTRIPTTSISRIGTGVMTRDKTSVINRADTNIMNMINTDVMNKVNTDVMTNVNVLSNVRTDIIARTKTDVDVFSKVGTDVMSKVDTNAMTDTFSNVNTNVNVMTPKIPFLWFPPLDFLGGEGGYTRKKRMRKTFRYTPDFISSVLDEYGPAPRQTTFTGQERRRKIRGRGTVSPLPRVNNGGIFGLIRTQLGV